APASRAAGRCGATSDETAASCTGSPWTSWEVGAAVPKHVRVKRVSAAQVRAYAGKSAEYAAAAASELEAGRSIAATSLAIHAAINAADAVCGARLGQRAAADDHDQVLVLLRQAGKDGAEIESDLRRLLPLKTK